MLIAMFRSLLLCAVLSASSLSFAQEWVKVWSDEFNTPGLPDTSKWSYDVGPYMNGEAQYYTYRRIENAHIDDTTLIIESRKEDYMGASYTSARILSRFNGDWLYGRIEARAKIPTGKGSFPAIWMMPSESKYGGWPSSGEIDIMENVGFEPENIYSTVHFYGTNGSGHQSDGTHVTRDAPYDTFYTYAIEWTPDKIDWFIDNDKVYTYTKPVGADYRLWPFDERFFLILNLAIGGDWGSVQGIDASIFPLKFCIDYVRAYKWQTDAGPYSLTIEPTSGGSVEVTPQQQEYTAGTAVQLTANSDPGYYFGGFLYMGNANPLEIQIADNLTVIPLFYKSGEFIKNGTFDRGISGWNNIYISDLANQAANAGWQDGVYVFQVIRPATEWWHMGDQWLNIPATQGKTYLVSFDAWADNPAAIGISFSKNHGDYAYYNENPAIAITTGKATYTWQFTFNAASDNNCRLYFGMGRFTGNVYLDNISMTQLGATSVEDIAKPAIPDVTVGFEPSTGQVHLGLELMQPGKVSLTVCNLQGIEIAVLFNGYLSAGSYQLQAGIDKTRTPAGVYLLRYKGNNSLSYTKFAVY
jgi:beta-glucanase (GH16 family)